MLLEILREREREKENEMKIRGGRRDFVVVGEKLLN